MGISLLDGASCFSPPASRRSSQSTGVATTVSYEGSLKYQGKDGKWKERWFQLDSSQIRLLKCAASTHQPVRSFGSVLGSSDGVRVADVEAVSSKDEGESGLEIVTTNGHRIRFLTKTQEDERAWISAIQKSSHGFTRGVTERLEVRELLAGKYALVRELGRGASGVVSLYTYQGKPFAIKKFVPQKAKGVPNRLAVPSAGSAGGRPVLARPKANDDAANEIPEDVRREIALLKKASHLPYVIKLHDVIVDSEERQYYLVMEYMGGGAIAEWDPERKCYARSRNQKSLSLLDEKTTRVYMTNLLLGIQALHHNGLCHRDIKPENLMANEDRTMCKIGDLGVAHYFHEEVDGHLVEEANPDNIALWDLTADSGTTGATCAASEPAVVSSPPIPQELPPVQSQRKAMLKSTKGTYQFLPPEALSGDEFDGFKADIWAAGVTLYALLFGYLPFYSNDLVKLFEKIERDCVVFPASCQDEEVKDLLLRILEKDPEKRISIEEILAHRWLHRQVDSKALAKQVRALKRAPALCVEAHELGGAVSVLQSRFEVLSQAVKGNSLGDLRHRDAHRKSGVESPADMISSYSPRPVVTSEVQIPAWLQEDIPALAAQLHFDWCLAKHVDGWAFSVTRDDGARLHPLLVPMRDLPADAQLKNVQCVEETLKCVLALGCHVGKRASSSRRRIKSQPSSSGCGLLPSDQVTLSWEMLMLVDLLAENSHEVWAAGYTQQGWSYGEVFDADGKKHPSLKPYMALEEAEKVLCRQGVTAVLKSCVYLGYEISCSRQPTKQKAPRRDSLST